MTATAGASPPQNFDCGGDRPRRLREVGAYDLCTLLDIADVLCTVDRYGTDMVKGDIDTVHLY